MGHKKKGSNLPRNGVCQERLHKVANAYVKLKIGMEAGGMGGGGGLQTEGGA